MGEKRWKVWDRDQWACESEWCGAPVPEQVVDRPADPDPVKLVLSVARDNVAEGGRPFACVIVRDGEVLAASPNRVAQTLDPTAHAEILAIREACVALRSESLEGCWVYVLAEPCPMCLSALYYASPEKVCYLVRRRDYHKYYSDDRRYFRFEEIYREIGRPLEERRMPMEAIFVAGGIGIFRDWQERSRHPEAGGGIETNGTTHD